MRWDCEPVRPFVGLSNEGNEEVKAMSDEAYQAKMLRWKGWIDEHFRGQRA